MNRIKLFLATLWYLLPVPKLTSQVVLVVENPPANAGDIRDAVSVSESVRSPGRGHSNPSQYSCLEYPMDRGAGWATVLGVAELDTTERLTLSLSQAPIFLLPFHKRHTG